MTDVSGSISIYDRRGSSLFKKINCLNKWFDNAEYCEFESDGECMTITKCYMDIPKTARKIPKSRVFDMKINAPIGTFEIDLEESTEDELVIYFNK